MDGHSRKPWCGGATPCSRIVSGLQHKVADAIQREWVQLQFVLLIWSCWGPRYYAWFIYRPWHKLSSVQVVTGKLLSTFSSLISTLLGIIIDFLEGWVWKVSTKSLSLLKFHLVGFNEHRFTSVWCCGWPVIYENIMNVIPINTWS